jgi:glycosyltransferase involved in cell wall biosynthesis
MRNVLIISYSFPPLNNIAARRFGEMVNYMEQFGWRPYIITTQSKGSLPVNINGEQCIRLGVHPQGDHCVNDVDSITRLSAMFESIRNITSKVNFRFRAVERTVLTWGNMVKEETDTILDRFPTIDLVMASYGPAASIWLGKWFADQYGVTWIADYRDLAALRRDNRPWLAYYADCIIERRLLRTCSGISTVSKHLANLLSEKYGKPCQAIYNGWNKQTIGLTNISQEKKKYVYYAGQFYSHRMEAVYYLLKALTRIESIYFKVRSLGPSELEQKIIAYASKLGIDDRVEILPPASPNIVEVEAQLGIANLVVEDMDKTNQWAAGTLTGKFLQLLPGNVPIMSIARPDNEMGDILERSGRGRLCSSVDQIAAFIVDAKNEPARFAGNHDVVDEFCKERQTKKLCSFFDAISGNK